MTKPLALVALSATLACRYAAPAAVTTPVIFRDSVPGTLVTFELAAVPAGPGVRAFLMGRTELRWDAYDAFMMQPTVARGSDAISRPSRPYGAPDYGWGHRGYATISVTRAAAQAFCAWLSAKTGKTYRLPTEAEWQHAAILAIGNRPLTPVRVDSLAWHAGNAANKTHPAGSRQPDALGLYDLFGNAAEWVVTDDGRSVVVGGSFRDAPAALGPHARAEQAESWNERDPQFPKSRWWLSDAPFVGFRIVRELP